MNNPKTTTMYHSLDYTCCLLVCLLPARIMATLSPGFCSRSSNIWKKPTAGGKLGDNSEFSLRLPLESKKRDWCLQSGIQSRDLSGFGELCLGKILYLKEFEGTYERVCLCSEVQRSLGDSCFYFRFQLSTILLLLSSSMCCYTVMTIKPASMEIVLILLGLYYLGRTANHF